MTIDRSTLPRIYLNRFAGTADAMYGRWEDAEHKQLAVTVERPDLNNAPGVSCIPEGEFVCAMRASVKHHGQVYGVNDVPDRSDIEIHPANLAVELEGCIALGKHFGPVTLDHGPPAGASGEGVLESDAAVADFVSLMRGQPFLLVVTNSAATPPSDPSENPQ
ncbi:MAG: DUF5675 family protein [Gemmatimonadales bacterium]